MNRINHKKLIPSFSFFILLTSFLGSFAQTLPNATKQVGDRVVLTGSVHRLATPERKVGHVDPSTRFEHMILVLKKSEEKRAAMNKLLAEQKHRGSNSFHQWLSPDQFGEKFGPSDQDLQRVTQWLTSYGFTVDSVGKGRGWINFSGTSGQVERAFQTEMHEYLVAGERKLSNSTEISLPSSIADVVVGPLKLNSFFSHPAHQVRQSDSLPHPNYTFGFGDYALAPADWATIYGASSILGTYDGTGAIIAIPGRSAISASDISSFRSNFGLSSNPPSIDLEGPDPGFVSGDETESVLDVEWAGAIAQNASVAFVYSGNNAVSDGISLASEAAVESTGSHIVSLSYIECESDLGSSGNTFWSDLWAEAAGVGTVVVVASGDAGAAACDVASGSSASHGAGVNGLASTPYNTAVGGTEFNEGSSYGTYWSSFNGTGGESAIGYIPEVVWNDSGSTLYSGGGGASSVYSKPSWQSAPGVPADGVRDIPDVAFSASGAHDPYLIYESGLELIGGTSAAAPSFASMLALLVQKEGAIPIGEINAELYSLATTQYGSGTGPTVFNDITSGNNSVPGQSGYSAGTGYDRASGLGSINAANLLSAFTSFTVERPTTASCQTGLNYYNADNESGPLSATTGDADMFSAKLSSSPTPPPHVFSCTWAGFPSFTTTGPSAIYFDEGIQNSGTGSSAYIQVSPSITYIDTPNSSYRYGASIPVGTDLSTISVHGYAKSCNTNPTRTNPLVCLAESYVGNIVIVAQ